jgi:hypothetical protein
MPRVPLLALALILAALVPSPARADEREEKITKFKRFSGNLSPETRRASVPLLEGIDDAEAASLLVDVLKDREHTVRDEAMRVLAAYRSEAAVTALEKAFESVATGRARAYVAMVLGRIGHPSSLPVLTAGASVSEWEVRRAVAEALGSYRDSNAFRALMGLAADSEPVVKTAAADSLGKAGDSSVVETINTLLADPAWQVRSAACAAAGRLRDKRSIVLLIELLKEDGRLKVDAKIALGLITGFNFGADAKEWKDWWDRSGSTFEVSPATATASAARRPKASDRRYAGPGTHYYGVSTPSKYMIFLLDVSRSMAEEIERKPLSGSGSPAYSSDVKMVIAKEELIRTIKGLKENVRFNIILFETEVIVWKKELVAASESMKADAAAFISKQSPRGVEVARNNRAVASVGNVGRTNIWDALERAFGIAGIGTYDRSYTTKVDTIFLVSDGLPTAGKLTNQEEILKEVQRLNALRRIVIHTISLAKLRDPFLRRLAEESGGQFVDLVGQTELLERN